MTLPSEAEALTRRAANQDVYLPQFLGRLSKSGGVNFLDRRAKLPGGRKVCSIYLPRAGIDLQIPLNFETCG